MKLNNDELLGKYKDVVLNPKKYTVAERLEIIGEKEKRVKQWEIYAEDIAAVFRTQTKKDDKND